MIKKIILFATIIGLQIQFVTAQVTTITGTANQVTASSSTGAVTLSLAQSIATSSAPTFGGLTLSRSMSSNNEILNISSSHATGNIAAAYFSNITGNLIVGVNNTAGTTIVNGTGGAGVISTNSPMPLELGTNQTVRYSISSAGNHDFKSGTATFGGDVGIGITSPGAKLHVDASTSSNLAKFVSTPGATLRGGGFSVDEAVNGRSMLWLDANGGNFTGGDYFYISHKGSTSGTDFVVQNAAPMAFLTDGAERLRIDAIGNVGIGTTTATEKLSVNGKIRSQEVKVESSNWPDFVFEPSYKLPALQETEKFVSENKHLPGIPSAKEAENDGINLGEMNAKLLQKIEELTLHLISQNKTQEALVTEVKQLRSEINQLKSKP